MLPLYKLLNYDHSAIQQQSVKLALEMDLVHNPIVSTSTALSLDTAAARIPGLQRFLDLYNFTLRQVGFSVLKELTSTGIYSEIRGHGAKIEIPVIGCEYSETIWYTNIKPYKFDLSVPTHYWRYHSEGAQEVDRFRLVRPTVVNITVPRSTTLIRRHVRRISLQLDVGPDAYTMLTNTTS